MGELIQTLKKMPKWTLYQRDGLVGDPPTSPPTDLPTQTQTPITPPPVLPANVAPSHTNFNAEQIGNGHYVISGHMNDEHPEGMTVRQLQGDSVRNHADLRGRAFRSQIHQYCLASRVHDLGIRTRAHGDSAFGNSAVSNPLAAGCLGHAWDKVDAANRAIAAASTLSESPVSLGNA